MLLLWQDILIVHSTLDDRSSQVESHMHSANLSRVLVKELCLTYCNRYVNHTTKLYTYNIRSFARLDRVYVSTF